jgi:hypothetical protein
MAIDKTKLRLDIIHSFGADFEDLLENAEKEIARNEGAQTALKTAQAKVAAMCEHVEKDLEDGVLDKLISGDDAGVLPLAAYVKRKIMQASGIVENLKGVVAVNKLQSEGALSAYKQVFEIVQKKHADATEKLEMLAKIESGELPEDAMRVRSPAADIRARKAEAQAEKEAQKEAESAAEPAEAQKPEPEPEPEEKPKAKKPRRSRKKK